MDLVQSRIVTPDVASLARFYAGLVGVDVVLNDYYVEVPAGTHRVGFSRVRFSEVDGADACGTARPAAAGEVILDFAVDDLDREHARIDGGGVEWVMKPTMQPWGRRSMMFRDPEGHLVNVFSSHAEARS